MDGKIHIVIPVDGAYHRWGEVTAASAVQGASCPVDVHFIDWSVCDRSKLETLGKWHGSAIAWSRMYLVEILSDDIEWVISCDADVLFRGDIAKLWALRDERYVVMISRDSMPPWLKENPTISNYCRDHGLDAGEILCSGIMLINLKRWRAEGWQAKVDAFVAKHQRAGFLDQITLNVVFKDVKSALPRPWGCFSGDLNADVDYSRDCAIHFVSDAPWKRYKLTQLMSDAVVLWRHQAGMPCGGWRRWLWIGLRATYSWWRGNKWLSWHFRNAAPRKNAVIIMHPAPYRDPVCNILSREGVEVAPIYGQDPNHPWAFGRVGALKTLWPYALSGDYRFVVWTAYWPLRFLMPIMVRLLLRREYAIAVDTTVETGGRIARAIKCIIFRKAKFIWVPGCAAHKYIVDNYRIPEDRLVDGLYQIAPEEIMREPQARELPSRMEDVKFLMVANEADFRRIDVLVEGFRRIGKGSLLLCGRGLGKYAGGNVKVVGGVTWDELPRLYSEADVYVHNGCEQYSTAVQIAALRGMPVVCSSHVGIASDIEVSISVQDWKNADSWAAAFSNLEKMLPNVPRTNYHNSIAAIASDVLEKIKGCK